MHAAWEEASLDQIAQSVKSKRYTRSRIDRMILCAFLGIRQADMDAPAPYSRVIAMSERGRAILKNARNTGFYPNIGEKTGSEYEVLEQRCDALYGLFATEGIEPPENKSRIYLRK